MSNSTKPLSESELAKQSDVRKEFDGAVTEILANQTLVAKDDYNKGWNDASRAAARVIQRYMRKEGLFQL